MALSTGCVAVCDMGNTPHEGQNPGRLQLNASSLSWLHSPQRSRRKPSGQDAAIWDVEFAPDEPEHLGAGAGLRLGDEIGRM